MRHWAKHLLLLLDNCIDVNHFVICLHRRIWCNTIDHCIYSIIEAWFIYVIVITMVYHKNTVIKRHIYKCMIITISSYKQKCLAIFISPV